MRIPADSHVSSGFLLTLRLDASAEDGHSAPVRLAHLDGSPRSASMERSAAQTCTHSPPGLAGWQGVPHADALAQGRGFEVVIL